MSSQGRFKTVIPSKETTDWFAERKSFILDMLGEDLNAAEPSSVSFNTFTQSSSDEEDIPEGYVLAVIEYQQAP